VTDSELYCLFIALLNGVILIQCIVVWCMNKFVNFSPYLARLPGQAVLETVQSRIHPYIQFNSPTTCLSMSSWRHTHPAAGPNVTRLRGKLIITVCHETALNKTNTQSCHITSCHVWAHTVSISTTCWMSHHKLSRLSSHCVHQHHVLEASMKRTFEWLGNPPTRGWWVSSWCGMTSW